MPTIERSHNLVRIATVRLSKLLVHILISASIGFGPLYAGTMAVGGFRAPTDLFWRTYTEPWFSWFTLVILGYFFGWTLTALAVDYEDFWPIPGRARAFRVLAQSDGPDRSLSRFIAETNNALGIELRPSRLNDLGFKVAGIDLLSRSYEAVRGWWLAAMTSFLLTLAHMIRQFSTGDSSAGGTLVATAGIAAAIGVSSLLSHLAGRALAERAADAIRRTNAASVSQPTRAHNT